MSSKLQLLAGLVLGLVPAVGPAYNLAASDGALILEFAPRALAAPALIVLEGLFHLEVPARVTAEASPRAVLGSIALFATTNSVCWLGLAFAVTSGRAARLIRGLRPGLTVASVLIGLIPALDIAHNLVENRFPSTWWLITRVTAWPAFAVIEYLSSGSWVLTASTHASPATYFERWTALVVVNVAIWTGAFQVGGVLLHSASVRRDRLKEAGRFDQDGSSQAK